jgi:hypothetical protein
VRKTFDSEYLSTFDLWTWEKGIRLWKWEFSETVQNRDRQKNNFIKLNNWLISNSDWWLGKRLKVKVVGWFRCWFERSFS